VQHRDEGDQPVRKDTHRYLALSFTSS
jgi:hypothetical protein